MGLVNDVAILEFSKVTKERGKFFLSNLLINVANV